MNLRHHGAIAMKRVLGALFAVSLFATSALAQGWPPVPLGPSGGSGGGGGGSGTVTSIATACGVSGGPITTSGTISGNVVANDPVAGSAYTFLASDCGKLVSFSDGTPRAPSLVTASFSAGNFINIANTGGGAQTITPTTGTICGAATLVLQQNQGIGVTFDGTNWQCSGGPYAPVNSGTVPLARMPTVLGIPSYISGNWYPNPYSTGTLGTSNAGTTNAYYCAPFWIAQTVTIKALSINVVATSTGNSNSALQGAVYSDLITTTPQHRPGTFIDYAGSGVAGFTTNVATQVSATMANTTDILTGPGLFWTCVQKFDTTATYTGFGPAGNGNMLAAAIGTPTLAKAIAPVGTSILTGISTTGSTYGSTGWVNFTSSTTWSEQGASVGPNMAIQVN